MQIWPVPYSLTVRITLRNRALGCQLPTVASATYPNITGCLRPCQRTEILCTAWVGPGWLAAKLGRPTPNGGWSAWVWVATAHGPPANYPAARPNGWRLPGFWHPVRGWSFLMSRWRR